MSNPKKTIMVTGATGLIGYNLIKSLLEDSHKVFAVIRNPVHSSNLPNGCIPSLCNILDSEPITEIVSRSDMIFHLAGIVGVGPSKIDPYNTIDTNVIGTINIMDAARYFEKPVVYAGVANIEDRSIYTITKATSERFLMMYNKEHNCNFLALRIFNVYGPGQSLKSGKLIINAINKGLLGKPISIFGEGNQIMDFIYIDDVVSHLKNCISDDNKFENKPFDVGTGVGISILDAVKTIIRLTGSRSKIIFEKRRSGDKMEKVIANKDNFIKGSFIPNTLEEGINKTIQSMTMVES